jgi:outer membrane protein assembly factor BamB
MAGSIFGSVEADGMSRRIRLAFILVYLAGGSLIAADWPQWRGPSGTGTTAETGLPVKWSATENVAWKAPIGGLGVSTPIVVGDRVFVTSQLGSGVRREGNHPRLVQGGNAADQGERALGGARAAALASDKTTFLVEAFHRSDGRRLWQHRVEAQGQLAGVHDKHNLASPSPVSDGQMVYAWFGTGQIVALDMNGKVVWQRHLGTEVSPFDVIWGHSSSPTLYGDTIILLCDHEPASYLLALDKRTGKQVWKAERGKGRMSYSTPLVVETPTGPELIVNSSERVDGYDPRNGTLLWFTGGTNRFPIPMPVFHNGVIYMSRGYRSSPYMAIRPGGRGDITKSHVVWESATGAPYISSLVFHEGLIYMATDVGAVTVVEAESGQRVSQQRIEGVFSASPVAADGKVYFVSENGETIVMQAGRTPSVLARNDLGERAIASPAISNGQIFIRTDDHVFAIGQRR